MTDLAAPDQNCVFIVMGVSGVGKTTIARSLAMRLPARYIEADDYHSDENLTAMQKGIALTDEMRLPWLQDLSRIAESARKDGHVAMACSALKRKYRDLFRARIGCVQFIFLHADRDVIAQRMADRTGHYMPVSLLDTQIATLEKPASDECAIAIDVAAAKEQLEGVIEAAVRRELI